MKKILTLLCLIAASSTFLLGSGVPIEKKGLKSKSAMVADNLTQFKGVVGEDGGNFDNSANGYGWYNGHSTKIDVNPANQFVTTTYRKLHATGNSGTWGGATGTFGDLESYPIHVSIDTNGARYPHGTSFDGFHFAFTIHYIDGTSGPTSVTDPVFSIFSEENEEWTERTVMIDENGEKLNNPWNPHASVNKNGDTYVVVSSWEVNGLQLGPATSISIVVGTTETPFDMDSWVWSDYQDLYFPTGISHVSTNNLTTGLNSNGLAFAATTQDQGNSNGDFLLCYTFSEDWGVNWNITSDSKLLSIQFADLFSDVWGSSVNNGASTISDIGITYDYDVMVTDNNKIHFACYVNMNDATSMYDYNDDGTPLTGWYDIVGVVDGDDITWTPHFISHKYGWEDDNMATNPGQIHIGHADSNNIFVTMMDRPENDPQATIFPGTSGSPNFDLVIDGYAVTSNDGGETWKTNDYLGSNGTTYKMATNITNTPDDLEEGWAGSDHGYIEGDDLVFFAVNQYYDPANPLPPPVEDYYDHQQFLHAWKLTADGVTGIDGEEVSLTKEFNLSQNYPNPFNPTTSINFVLKNNGKVNLSVFNTKGEVVSVLANEQMSAGSQSFTFDASNFNSGVYFYQLNVNGITESKKMVLTK